MTKALIAGAGEVGVAIAKYLTQVGVDVTLIDQSQTLANQLSESIDVQTVVGHCALPETLDKAGAQDADMVIAVTRSDEVNMVICQVAMTIFAVPVKIARIRNQSYLNMRYAKLFNDDHIPIDYIISPEQEIANTICERLSISGSLETLPMADDQVRIIGVRCQSDCPIINTPLRQLTGVFPDLEIEILAIHRDRDLIVPDSDNEMIYGDQVYFAAQTSHAQRAMAAFGYEEDALARIIIVGGGTIGFDLAQRLLAGHRDLTVVVIENDPQRAEEIAVAEPSLVVLCGNALENDVLAESDPHNCNGFVAVTDSDETNVLACLLARQRGAPHTMALSNKQTYSILLPHLEIDSLISPKEITISSVLKLIRRGRVRQAHALLDGRAEILDATIPEGSSWIDIPLGETDIPNDVRIGAIIRDQEVTIGRPGVILRAGDRVILFTSRESLPAVEAMLAGQT